MFWITILKKYHRAVSFDLKCISTGCRIVLNDNHVALVHIFWCTFTTLINGLTNLTIHFRQMFINSIIPIT